MLSVFMDETHVKATAMIPTSATVPWDGLTHLTVPAHSFVPEMAACCPARSPPVVLSSCEVVPAGPVSALES